MATTGASATAYLKLDITGFRTGLTTAMRELNKLSTSLNKIGTGSKGLSTISKNMGSIGTNAGNMANQIETALKSIADMNGDFTAAAEGLSIMSKAVGELVRVGQGLTGVATKIKNIGTALKGISDAGNIFNAPLVNIETQVNGATNAVVNGTTKMKSSFTSTRDSAISFSNNVTQGFVRLQQALNFTPKFDVMKAGMMNYTSSVNIAVGKTQALLRIQNILKYFENNKKGGKLDIPFGNYLFLSNRIYKLFPGK